MLIIGLAGGIASGKSFVATEIQRMGAAVIDADLLGHQVLMMDEVREKLVIEFGTQILDSRGSIDRKALAALVFGGDSDARHRLRKLEEITHPRIESLVKEQLRAYRETGFPAVVVDAAVMFKSGWNKWCDRVVFIHCSEKTRIERALQRGWTKEELQKRESNQFPLDQKLRLATDVVNNNDGVEPSLAEQIRALWVKWGLGEKKNAAEVN